MYQKLLPPSRSHNHHDSSWPLATNLALENTISLSPGNSVSSASRIQSQQTRPSASSHPVISPRTLKLHFQSRSSSMGETLAASWTWKLPAASSRTAASLTISSVPANQSAARDPTWSLAHTPWNREKMSEGSTIMFLTRPRPISPRSAFSTLTS